MTGAVALSRSGDVVNIRAGDKVGVAEEAYRRPSGPLSVVSSRGLTTPGLLSAAGSGDLGLVPSSFGDTKSFIYFPLWEIFLHTKLHIVLYTTCHPKVTDPEDPCYRHSPYSPSLHP